jgi:uncharacterized protein YlxP (DUF503 family)
MIVGVLQAELRIDWARSLKDKRRVARSLKDRLHREHQVSVAEVEAQEIHNTLVLGIAAAGSSAGQVIGTLDAVESKLTHHEEATLVACQREVLRGWTGELAAGAFSEAAEADLAAEMLAHADDQHEDGPLHAGSEEPA